MLAINRRADVGILDAEHTWSDTDVYGASTVLPLRRPGHSHGASPNTAGDDAYGSQQASGQDRPRAEGLIMEQPGFADSPWDRDGRWRALGEVDHVRTSAVRDFVANFKYEMSSLRFCTKFMIGCAGVAAFILIV